MNEDPIFTLAQYGEENGEAVANGLPGQSYQNWVAWRKHLARVFRQLDNERKVNATNARVGAAKAVR